MRVDLIEIWTLRFFALKVFDHGMAYGGHIADGAVNRVGVAMETDPREHFMWKPSMLRNESPDFTAVCVQDSHFSLGCLLSHLRAIRRCTPRYLRR